MSSGVQVTPRKRKTGTDDAPTPSSSGKGKGRAVPTPNPPIVPFPTPPATRHRKDKLPVPPRQPDFVDAPTPPVTPSKRLDFSTVLPPQVQTLLTLHHAFNLALSLYIATHPPVLPPHPPSATSVDLPNLTNLLAIKETVERSSGRRFGQAELARLAWLWSWDGKALPDDKEISAVRGEEEDNPFLVPSDKPTTSRIRVEGLSYLITPTRTLDHNGRRVHTYGLGIELDFKPGETRQILHGGAEGGLGNRGQGGGTGAIGRWSAGGEGRQEVVRERLERWVELNGGWEPPVQTDLPTPSTSGSSRSTIPPIPILPLPHLPTSTLLPSANLFSCPKLDSSPGLTSTPKKSGLADPFVLDEKEKKGKVMHSGSVEERKQAMMDRIKARSGSSRLPTLGSAVGKIDTIRPRMSAAEQQEELKRRSTLSRLEGVAEGVWMMFSAPSPGPSTLPTPPRGRRRAIPMAEVADVIVKSSKTPISTAEAITSLQLLTDLCPFFLTVKTIARQEWLEMPSTLVQSACPPSPGSTLSPRAAASPKVSPRGEGRGTVPECPGSPTPGARRTMVPLPPLSPTRGGGLAGAASPGRVRRVGGLREVRERIRRELGE